MLKTYKVALPGFVHDGKPYSVGSTVDLDPRNGGTVCGIRFKQLKPIKAEEAKKPAAEATPAAKAGPPAKKQASS